MLVKDQPQPSESHTNGLSPGNRKRKGCYECTGSTELHSLRGISDSVTGEVMEDDRVKQAKLPAGPFFCCSDKDTSVPC